jgi:hypothetical protein
MYYDTYIKRDTEGACRYCNQQTTFTGSIIQGYATFCSNKCQCRYNAQQRIGTHHDNTAKQKICQKLKAFYKTAEGKRQKRILSDSRLGGLNPIHKQTPESRTATAKKISDSMKKLIVTGKFTPCITNSWCRSRVIINNIPFRSSWEAVFYILNDTVQYEKIRIPYVNESGVERIYIVDFLDELNKRLFEIKPKSNRHTPNNMLKEQAAKKWASQNGYSYTIITDEYFYINAKKIDYNLYDPKLKASMTQFLKYEN